MNNLETITNACRELLLNFEPAREVQEYIDKRLPRSAQEEWCFGYFPPNEHLQSLLSIVGSDALKQTDILYDHSYADGFASAFTNHNMVMPYRDHYGEVIGIVGRSTLPDEGRKTYNIEKYKNTHFKKGRYLFGLDKAKGAIIKQGNCIIVEGQMDTISGHNKGIQNIVAIGSSNLTFNQFALLYRYTNNIILLLDEDKAGQSGEDKIIKEFGKFANIQRAHLPMGVKDLDEYLKEIDMEDFELIIK